MSTTEKIVDGWSITLLPSRAARYQQFAEQLESGVCIPHGTFYDSVTDGNEPERLPLHLDDQEQQVKIVAVSVGSLGFRFGARPESIIARAKDQGFRSGSPSIVLALGTALAGMKIFEPGEWFWMPTDRAIPNTLTSRPRGPIILFEIFCDNKFEEVDTSDAPMYEQEFDELDASGCVQVDVSLSAPEWLNASQVLFFVK